MAARWILVVGLPSAPALPLVVGSLLLVAGQALWVAVLPPLVERFPLPAVRFPLAVGLPSAAGSPP